MDFEPPQQRKSVIGIIILFLFIIMIVGGLTYGGYYYYKNGYLKKNEAQQLIPKITFFVQPKDHSTGEDIDLNYEIFESQNIKECLNKDSFKLYKDKPEEFYERIPLLRGKNIDEKGCYVKKQIFTKVNEGALFKGYNVITINPLAVNLFYYFSNDYYVKKELWIPGYMTNTNISLEETDISKKNPENRTIAIVYAHKKEDYLNISLLGDIQNDESSVMRILLQGQNSQFRHIILCFKYGVSIVDLNSIAGLIEWDIPKRLPEINKCFKTETSLSKNNDFKFQTDFNITTINLQEDDEIEVYAIDEDLIYDGENWIWRNEDYSGKNIGAKDFSKSFKI